MKAKLSELFMVRVHFRKWVLGLILVVTDRHKWVKLQCPVLAACTSCTINTTELRYILAHVWNSYALDARTHHGQSMVDSEEKLEAVKQFCHLKRILSAEDSCERTVSTNGTGSQLTTENKTRIIEADCYLCVAKL